MAQHGNGNIVDTPEADGPATGRSGVGTGDGTTSTPPSRPPMRASNEATDRQLGVARRQGDAYGDRLVEPIESRPSRPRRRRRRG